jgi:hypothetical protein
MNPTTRRNFLKTASAATLAALAARYPTSLLAAEESKPKPTADSLIILWMAGGMAHTETWDPKRYTPSKRASNPTRSSPPSPPSTPSSTTSS